MLSTQEVRTLMEELLNDPKNHLDTATNALIDQLNQHAEVRANHGAEILSCLVCSHTIMALEYSDYLDDEDALARLAEIKALVDSGNIDLTKYIIAVEGLDIPEASEDNTIYQDFLISISAQTLQNFMVNTIAGLNYGLTQLKQNEYAKQATFNNLITQLLPLSAAIEAKGVEQITQQAEAKLLRAEQEAEQAERGRQERIREAQRQEKAEKDERERLTKAILKAAPHIEGEALKNLSINELQVWLASIEQVSAGQKEAEKSKRRITPPTPSTPGNRPKEKEEEKGKKGSNLLGGLAKVVSSLTRRENPPKTATTSTVTTTSTTTTTTTNTNTTPEQPSTSTTTTATSDVNSGPLSIAQEPLIQGAPRREFISPEQQQATLAAVNALGMGRGGDDSDDEDAQLSQQAAANPVSPAPLQPQPIATPLQPQPMQPPSTQVQPPLPQAQAPAQPQPSMQPALSAPQPTVQPGPVPLSTLPLGTPTTTSSTPATPSFSNSLAQFKNIAQTVIDIAAPGPSAIIKGAKAAKKALQNDMDPKVWYYVSLITGDQSVLNPQIDYNKPPYALKSGGSFISPTYRSHTVIEAFNNLTKRIGEDNGTLYNQSQLGETLLNYLIRRSAETTLDPAIRQNIVTLRDALITQQLSKILALPTNIVPINPTTTRPAAPKHAFTTANTGNGETPLHVAIRFGAWDVVEKLLQFAAAGDNKPYIGMVDVRSRLTPQDVAVQRPEQGQTPLGLMMLAKRNGIQDPRLNSCFRILRDGYAAIPLSYGPSQQSMPDGLLQESILYGVSTGYYNVRDAMRYAIVHANQEGIPFVLNFLAAQETNQGKQEEQYLYPVHQAIMHNNIPALTFLLKNGYHDAGIDQSTRITPLQCAAKYRNNTAIIQLVQASEAIRKARAEPKSIAASVQQTFAKIKQDVSNLVGQSDPNQVNITNYSYALGEVCGALTHSSLQPRPATGIRGLFSSAPVQATEPDGNPLPPFFNLAQDQIFLRIVFNDLVNVSVTESVGGTDAFNRLPTTDRETQVKARQQLLLANSAFCETQGEWASAKSVLYHAAKCGFTDLVAEWRLIMQSYPHPQLSNLKIWPVRPRLSQDMMKDSYVHPDNMAQYLNTHFNQAPQFMSEVERIIQRNDTLGMLIALGDGANPLEAAKIAMREDKSEILDILYQHGSWAEWMLQQSLKEAIEQENLVAIRGIRRQCQDPAKLFNEALNEEGDKAIHLAVRAGNISVVDELLRTDGDYNYQVTTTTTNRQQQNALHIAAAQGNAASTQTLLNKAPSATRITGLLHVQDHEGNTPLHLAVLSDNESTVRAILNHDQDTAEQRYYATHRPTAGEANDYTPCALAIAQDKRDILDLFLYQGNPPRYVLQAEDDIIRSVISRPDFNAKNRATIVSLLRNDIVAIRGNIAEPSILSRLFQSAPPLLPEGDKYRDIDVALRGALQTAKDRESQEDTYEQSKTAQRQLILCIRGVYMKRNPWTKRYPVEWLCATATMLTGTGLFMASRYTVGPQLMQIGLEAGWPVTPTTLMFATYVLSAAIGILIQVANRKGEHIRKAADYVFNTANNSRIKYDHVDLEDILTGIVLGIAGAGTAHGMLKVLDTALLTSTDLATSGIVQTLSPTGFEILVTLVTVVVAAAVLTALVTPLMDAARWNEGLPTITSL